MSSAIKEIFASHRTTPLHAESFKQVGTLLSQSSQSEIDLFFESCEPTEHHLQLLKLCAAKSTGHISTLLKGVKEESKDVSKLCRDSKLLYKTTRSQLYDPQFLLPLLEEVSRSTRNRLIWNLGKYMPDGNSELANTLYNNIARIWGISVAAPLFCKASEDLIKQELPTIRNLSKFQLLILAKRFPYIALTYLEERPGIQHPLKAVRLIVRNTMPISFKYCLKNHYSNVLSRSTMRLVLRKYTNLVLESASEWVNVLDKRIVKKELTPENFQLLVTKQFLEIEDFHRVPLTVVSYFKLLPANQISSVLKQTFDNKYNCAFDSKLEFWENNIEFLKLLDSSDRNNIAIQLDEKCKGHKWVPHMTCDRSIPRIKEELQNEVNAHSRAELVSRLIETTVINNDTNSLEEVCKFVAVRYRNDKDVLQALFDSVPDLSLVSTETWTVMFELAYKFCSSPDWHVRSAFKFLPTAIDRRGKIGLKMYLEQFMSGSMNYFLNIEDLAKMKPELRAECINQVFTKVNVESSDYAIQERLMEFLSLILQWNAKSVDKLVFPNVNTFVLNTLQSDDSRNILRAIDFVVNKSNGLDITFIETSFQLAPVPKLLWYLLRSKRSPVLIDDKTSVKIATQALKSRLWSRGPGYVTLIKKLKKLGYVKTLELLNKQSQAVITDTEKSDNVAAAILLLALTTPNTKAYFAFTDPFLPGNDDIPTASQLEVDNEDQHQKLQNVKWRDLRYKGICVSFSHIDVPSTTINRLLRFCVGGDLMLFARDAIYSVCSSVLNSVAQKIIHTLVQRPISVKKHALRLHRAVSDIEAQKTLLLQLMETEIHLTSRTVLLQSAIICLNNSNTASIWEVTKEMMKRLTPDDTSIAIVLRESIVPDPFVEEYLQLLLEKSKLLKKVTPEFLSEILCIVCRKTTIVSELFIECILREYFLSEIFFESICSHGCVCDLFLAYLKGAGIKDSSSLEARQYFFKDMLNSCVTESTVYSYNSKLGCFPIRKLLSTFVETYCRHWVTQLKGEDEGTNFQCYKDIILEFLNQFNKNVLFDLFVYVSLTAIVKQETKKSSVGIGAKIGDFCDSVTRDSPELSRYTLPGFVGRYFEVCYFDMNTNQKISMLSEILPSLPVKDGPSLLRLMVVAYILPSEWLTQSNYDSFRELFMPFIKDTPLEMLLFKG